MEIGVSFLRNETFVLNNSLYFSVEAFQKLNDRLIVGFTTRKNGYSMKPYDSLNLGLHVQDEEKIVIKNRDKLANELKIPLNNWVFAEQVHGNNIKKVTREAGGSGALTMATAVKDTDGLYTQENNILLGSLYADCVPLYFYSPLTDFIGLAHAGWKGTVGKIGTKMIQRWVNNENIPLESIYVAIGPSISGESYEVDDYVINKVNNVMLPNHEFPYVQTSEHKYLLDLKQLNKQLLLDAGVFEENIFVSNFCTFKETNLFYSYRRNSQTGRMMSFIGKV